MITLAIPTGRLGDQVLTLLKKAALIEENLTVNRQLMIETATLRLLFVKPSDVITYVVSSQADLGIVGNDLILEDQPSIIELLDLKIGVCQMMVAGFNPSSKQSNTEGLRVASKYPNITRTYFQKKNQPIQLTYLKGSVELAPLIALSDVIVDITETGRTLKENGLTILDTIMPISARLIANEASYFLETNSLLSIKDQLAKEVI
jgi:ATP phosphoribosyltransferase